MLGRAWRGLLGWLGFAPRPQFIAKITPSNPSPNSIRKGTLIVVGGQDYQKWAYFRCPCDCGETIMLSLSKTTRPSWSVSIDSHQRPTISPSVRQIAGCFSHFWVREGNVQWCRDTGRPWTSKVWDSE
jgi:hypothetical protein